MIKGFNQYLMESEGAFTQEQKDWLDKCTSGKWTLNPSTGLVDVFGDFNCNAQGLKNFMGVRFGKVTGYFNCSSNKLTSLEGAPNEVSGNFWCYENQLTSLEGSPQEVGGSFWCYSNKLKSLAGSPSFTYEGFSCYNNQLTSLEGAPEEVGGGFYCESNLLTSFEGSLKKVNGSLYADNNPLVSLKGIPDFNFNNFYIRNTPAEEIFYKYAGKIQSMSESNKKIVFKMLSLLDPLTNEGAERIVKSVERMDMI